MLLNVWPITAGDRFVAPAIKGGVLTSAAATTTDINVDLTLLPNDTVPVALMFLDQIPKLQTPRTVSAQYDNRSGSKIGLFKVMDAPCAIGCPSYKRPAGGS